MAFTDDGGISIDTSGDFNSVSWEVGAGETTGTIKLQIPAGTVVPGQVIWLDRTVELGSTNGARFEFWDVQDSSSWSPRRTPAKDMAEDTNIFKDY